jgi:hypothetical protein
MVRPIPARQHDGVAGGTRQRPFDITGTDSKLRRGVPIRPVCSRRAIRAKAIYAHSSTGRRTVRLSPLSPGSNGLQSHVASPSVDDAGLFVGFAVVTPGVT